MLAVMKVREEADALEVKELPIPRPGPGEILVKMGAAGICYNSDVMILKNSTRGGCLCRFR